MYTALNFPSSTLCPYCVDSQSACFCPVSDQKGRIAGSFRHYPYDYFVTATFYSAAKSLLAYVDISMHTVPMECAAGPHWHESEDGSRQKGAAPLFDARLAVTLGQHSTAREIIIMAAVVLLVKMRYGLDGEERYVQFKKKAE